MMTDLRRGQRARIQIALALVYGVTGVLAYTARRDLSEFVQIDPRIVLLSSLGMIGAAAAIVLMAYLRGDVSISALDALVASPYRSSDSGQVFISSSLHDVRTDMLALRARLEEIATTQAGGKAGDRTALVKSLTESIAGDVATELAKRFAADATAASQISLAREVFAATHARLREQIEALNRRANLNLIIGVMTTLLAVGLLAYMVLNVSATFTEMTSLLSYYVPRVATGVFIEVFSFFFLRLYKSSLAEVQYYQNELTQLAVQQIALEVAHARPDVPIIAAVVEGLAKGHDGTAVAARTTGSIDQLMPLADLVQQVAKLVADISKTK